MDTYIGTGEIDSLQLKILTIFWGSPRNSFGGYVGIRTEVEVRSREAWLSIMMVKLEMESAAACQLYRISMEG